MARCFIDYPNSVSFLSFLAMCQLAMHVWSVLWINVSFVIKRKCARLFCSMESLHVLLCNSQSDYAIIYLYTQDIHIAGSALNPDNAGVNRITISTHTHCHVMTMEGGGEDQSCSSMFSRLASRTSKKHQIQGLASHCR